jgi:uncharacterized DUF497 family protein
MVIVKLPGVLSFEWDTGNKQKNWLKHKVTSEEAEEAFDDEYRLNWLRVLWNTEGSQIDQGVSQ